MQKEKLRRLRFTYDDETTLLREIVAQNCITNPEKWEQVQHNVEKLCGKSFQVRTLKNHAQILLDLWVKKEEVATKKSGVEEPYNERDVLLQEIHDMNRECEGLVKKKKCAASQNKAISELGKQIREKCATSLLNYSNQEEENINPGTCNTFQLEHAENLQYDIIIEENVTNVPSVYETVLQEHDYGNLSEETKAPKRRQPLSEKKAETLNRNIAGPSRRKINKSHPLRKNALMYLNEKNERECNIRERELELEEKKLEIEGKKLAIEERKISLQEKRMEMERTEMQQKLEFEKERLQVELRERNLTQLLLESQQKIIDSFLKANLNKNN